MPRRATERGNAYHCRCCPLSLHILFGIQNLSKSFNSIILLVSVSIIFVFFLSWAAKQRITEEIYYVTNVSMEIKSSFRNLKFTILLMKLLRLIRKTQTLHTIS